MTGFKKILKYAVLVMFMVMMVGQVKVKAEGEAPATPSYKLYKAQVMKITFDNTKVSKEKGNISGTKYQDFVVKILEGPHMNEGFNMKNVIDVTDVQKLQVREGDKILVNITEDDKGKITTISIYDHVRDNTSYVLIIVFFLSLALIGGKKGLKSIVTLILTAILIIKVLIPMIAAGYNPVMSAIIICAIIVCATMMIIGGINKKTTVAILGTVGGVSIAGITALIAGNVARVTGLANEESQMVAYLHKNLNLDFKGILFAAIIIGALGAVMDVSISIASAMSEIKEIKPNISKKELFKSGMNIGKDIMGTMSNTLILANAGAAFQLILLYALTNVAFVQIINFDLITSEIITALTGSIGLVWTIPITALISVWMQDKKISLKSIRRGNLNVKKK